MVAIATQPSLRWRRPRKRSNMGGCIIIIVVLLLVFLAIAAFSVLMFEFSDTPMQMTPGHHSVIPSRLPRNGKGMSSPKGKYNRTTAPPQTHRISLCNTTDAIDRQACLLANRRAKPVPKKRPVVVRRPLPLDAVILCNNLPKDSPSVVEQEAIRNRLSTSMDRFRRVSPNRTLLELLAEARGPGVKTNIEALAAAPPVQVRFLTVTTGVDAYTVSSVAGAAVSGVRLEILGVGWKDFSFPGRFALLLSYIEKEGLKDSDVVMLMDNDAMFVGLDPYLAIQSFVTLSPAAREDLAGCARDIRLGWRMAPIRFTAENYCMRRQVAPVGKCTPDYDIMARMVGSWRPMSESAFEKEDLSVNATNRYLNTGVMVARVWALRTYVPILHMYTRTHTPISDGPAWTSDQSITATLYLHLRWWEVMSGVLNGTQPRPLTTAQLAASELRGRPDFAPTDDLAPYGLPAGLMDIDVYNRLASILAITTETRGSLTYGPVRIYKSHRAAFRGIDRAQKELYCNSSLCIGKSPIDTTISKVSLRLVRRSGVECAEEMMHTARCRFVAASLGQTTATSVTPLVWHYAGNEKMQTARDYSKWLPWRAAGRVSASFLADTLHVIHQGLTVQMWNAHGKLGKVGEYPTIGDQNVSGYALDFPNFCRRAK